MRTTAEARARTHACVACMSRYQPCCGRISDTRFRWRSRSSSACPLLSNFTVAPRFVSLCRNHMRACMHGCFRDSVSRARKRLRLPASRNVAVALQTLHAHAGKLRPVYLRPRCLAWGRGNARTHQSGGHRQGAAAGRGLCRTLQVGIREEPRRPRHGARMLEQAQWQTIGCTYCNAADAETKHDGLMARCARKLQRPCCGQHPVSHPTSSSSGAQRMLQMVQVHDAARAEGVVKLGSPASSSRAALTLSSVKRPTRCRPQASSSFLVT